MCTQFARRYPAVAATAMPHTAVEIKTKRELTVEPMSGNMQHPASAAVHCSRPPTKVGHGTVWVETGGKGSSGLASELSRTKVTVEASNDYLLLSPF